MQTGEYTRKLAALLSADVKGYSRLMEDDDVSTVKTLREYRTVIQSLVERFRGRVVDTPGDNILAQFASAIDAVRCAIGVQEELKKRNQALPDPRKMEFRIGINVGDIIEEGGRIYGDGVNIAARIEGLAEGGGICISKSAYEYVKSKLSLLNEYIGEHSVKNITEPVGVYRLFSVNSDMQNTSSDIRTKSASSERQFPKKLFYPAAAAVLVIVAGLLFWNRGSLENKESTAPLFQMSFENDQDGTISVWESNPAGNTITIAPAGELADHQSRSLRVKLPTIDYPGIFTCNIPKEWTGYHQFSMDVFLDAPAGEKEHFGIRIDDINTTSYYNRFNDDFVIISGPNRIEIPMEQIAAAIDITQIRCLYFFLEKPKVSRTLHFDNIRVE